MRAKNNMALFSGVEWTYWKERKMYLKQVHRAALAACKRGLVYTTYFDKESIYDHGQIIKSKDVPKWVGIQEEETDVTLRATYEPDKLNKPHFYISVENSKSKSFKTGAKVEITDRGLTEAFGLK